MGTVIFFAAREEGQETTSEKKVTVPNGTYLSVSASSAGGLWRK